MTRTSALAVPAVALAAALALPACGGHSSAPRSSASRSGATPAPGATAQRPADPANVRVIRGWADALRQGRVDRATGYFALPAIVQNGDRAFRLRTRAEVRVFNATLPCGAVLARAYSVGGYTVAVFHLTNRLGEGGEQGCDAAPGAAAGTAFAIRGGRITQWRRVPVTSGPATPAPTGPAV